MQYLWNLLVSLDQFVNTVAGGDPDETISSRAAKADAEGKRWGCILCGLLDKIQKDHCQRSLEPDEGARAIIPD
jgi:hypothetical protein